MFKSLFQRLSVRANQSTSFGIDAKSKSLFLAKALIGSTVAAVAISELVLTDERMDSLAITSFSLLKKAKEMGKING
jgi:hypothetical protein